MLSWKPVKNLEIKETDVIARRKTGLVRKYSRIAAPILFVLVLYSTASETGTKLLEIALFIFIISIIFFWLRYRRQYIALMEKSGTEGKLYTEDYSWKDSITILLLLLLGIVFIFFLLFKFFPKA